MFLSYMKMLVIDGGRAGGGGGGGVRWGAGKYLRGRLTAN